VGTPLISSLAHLTLGRDVMVGLGVKTDRYSITSRVNHGLGKPAGLVRGLPAGRVRV
jgi:hypothetical protein